jgi:hypothetical protein
MNRTNSRNPPTKTQTVLQHDVSLIPNTYYDASTSYVQGFQMSVLLPIFSHRNASRPSARNGPLNLNLL